MSYISVCKNVIARNNKRGWVDPSPAIRVSRTPSGSGKSVERGNEVRIVDKDGGVVATIFSTTDGRPVLKCGAKVAIHTVYTPTVLL